MYKAWNFTRKFRQKCSIRTSGRETNHEQANPTWRWYTFAELAKFPFNQDYSSKRYFSIKNCSSSYRCIHKQSFRVKIKLSLFAYPTQQWNFYLVLFTIFCKKKMSYTVIKSSPLSFANRSQFSIKYDELHSFLSWNNESAGSFIIVHT